MKPALSLLACISLAACTVASDSPPPEVDGGSDSTMVVASGARVPSQNGPRVVFLGTSLTAGLGLEGSEDGYVEALDALADSAGLPMDAVNAGVSGETSAGGLRRLDWVLRSPLDVLFLELGANDGLRGQDPEALRNNLVEIIEQTRTRYPGARIVLAGMEAPPNLGPIYTTAFRQVFTDVAERHDVVLVPFLLDGVAGVPELNQEDRIHPTEEGHAVVARTVWPHLADVLRDVKGPS
ncbi:MAG: arylesterase [Gemmatimonadetes bacterium]|nr:arylesterase [Gemmatimonadota bacterium]